MARFQAITLLENAGKHIVESRGMRNTVASFTAVEAAHSGKPDLQALAVISVLLARVTGADDDGWVTEVCTALGIQAVSRG